MVSSEALKMFVQIVLSESLVMLEDVSGRNLFNGSRLSNKA